MTKRRLLTFGLGLLVIILLGLVILTTFNFQKKKLNIHEDLTDNKQEEIVFNNNSDMTEQDIRLLVEEKRVTLKNIIENIKYYNLSEISSDYNAEDDQEYIAIDEDLLNELKKILTSIAYTNIEDELTKIEPDANVLLDKNIYKCSKSIFDDIAYNSAVAFYDVNEEQLILESATNEKIVAIERIKLCDEENTEICTRNSKYHFILEKEDNDWKISELLEKVE